MGDTMSPNQALEPFDEPRAWSRVAEVTLDPSGRSLDLRELATAWAQRLTEALPFNVAGLFRLLDDSPDGAGLDVIALDAPIGARTAWPRIEDIHTLIASSPEGVWHRGEAGPANEVPASHAETLGLANVAWASLALPDTGDDRPDELSGTFVALVGWDDVTGPRLLGEADAQRTRVGDFGTAAVTARLTQMTPRYLRLTAGQLLRSAEHLADRRALRAEQRQAHELRARLETATKQLARVSAERLVSERLRATTQVTAGVAHAVNNPASYILSHLDELTGLIDAEHDAAGTSRTQMARLVDDVRKGMEHIVAVVRELGRFTGSDGRSEAVALRDLLEGAVRLTRSDDLDCTFEIQPTGPLPAVRANQADAAQILMSLLSNAVTRVSRRTTPGRVSLKVSPTGAGRVAIIVADDGPGIAPEAAVELFVPFLGADEANATGLGLSVAQALAQRNGGALRLLDTAPDSTRFQLELPAAPATDTDDTLLALDGNLNVLVIDDNPMVLRAHLKLLGRRFQVDGALGPEEGLVRLETGQYDIVLCDLMMPGLSGLDVWERARAMDARWAARFVFVSGGVVRRADRAALAAEGLPVVYKPIRRGSLDGVIAERLKQLRPRR